MRRDLLKILTFLLQLTSSIRFLKILNDNDDNKSLMLNKTKVTKTNTELTKAALKKCLITLINGFKE